MQRPEFLLGPGLAQDAADTLAHSLTKQRHCPVGILDLPGGTRLLFALDSEEARDGVYDRVICDEGDTEPRIVKTADDCEDPKPGD